MKHLLLLSNFLRVVGEQAGLLRERLFAAAELVLYEVDEVIVVEHLDKLEFDGLHESPVADFGLPALPAELEEPRALLRA